MSFDMSDPIGAAETDLIVFSAVIAFVLFEFSVG
jgi:hypothetical protein